MGAARKKGAMMKVVKRFLTCILSLAIIFNVLVLPAATVNAYTAGIGSLTVQDFYRTYANASTTSSGTVYVILSINTYNTVTKTYQGSGTGNSGVAYTSVYLPAGTDCIIMDASSFHSDPYTLLKITWDVYGGYFHYYY